MQLTQIAWCIFTWNPFSGCRKISPGCTFCYASRLAEQKRGTHAFPNGFELTVRPHKLLEPFKLKFPSLIFLNSMSDLFWDQVDPTFRHQIVDVIEATPQHQYQVLTKRPEPMLEFSRERPLPRNFWAGVSIESEEYAWRADVLREVDAAVRFLSLEPLLGPIDIDFSPFAWAIAGGESGPHLNNSEHAERALVKKVGRKWVPREDRIEWVREIRDACVEAGTPFFFKQWGGPTSKSGGNELDGRVWAQMPLNGLQ
jgi:protein gp37